MWTGIDQSQDRGRFADPRLVCRLTCSMRCFPLEGNMVGIESLGLGRPYYNMLSLRLA